MSNTHRPDYLPATGTILEAFMEEVESLGGTVPDVYDDGRRLCARAVSAENSDVRPGDVIRGGVAVRVIDAVRRRGIHLITTGFGGETLQLVDIARDGFAQRRPDRRIGGHAADGPCRGVLRGRRGIVHDACDDGRGGPVSTGRAGSLDHSDHEPT